MKKSGWVWMNCKNTLRKSFFARFKPGKSYSYPVSLFNALFHKDQAKLIFVHDGIIE